MFEFICMEAAGISGWSFDGGVGGIGIICGNGGGTAGTDSDMDAAGISGWRFDGEVGGFGIICGDGGGTAEAVSD